MYVCMYVCMYACMYACMHVCTYVYIYINKFGCICTCRCIYIYAYLHWSVLTKYRQLLCFWAKKMVGSEKLACSFFAMFKLIYFIIGHLQGKTGNVILYWQVYRIVLVYHITVYPYYYKLTNHIYNFQKIKGGQRWKRYFDNISYYI